MKAIRAALLSLEFFAALACAQPTISSVVNGASYSQPPLPNSSIAQGSLFTIFGTNLGPEPGACGPGMAACMWAAYPLPTAIQGTSVQITVNGVTTKAIINLATSTQINSVMPSSTPAGKAQVTVTVNGTASDPFNITIVRSSFGIFTVNQAGTGPGIVTNQNFEASTPLLPTPPDGVA